MLLRLAIARILSSSPTAGLGLKSSSAIANIDRDVHAGSVMKAPEHVPRSENGLLKLEAKVRPPINISATITYLVNDFYDVLG